MNLLNKLTYNNLKLNKKRSIVTIIGILLSVSLISAVCTMYSSFIDSTIIYEKSIKGNHHLILKDVPIKEVETLKNNTKIEHLNLKKGIGYIKLEASQNEYKPYGYILAYDNQALLEVQNDLIDGRLPNSENEILISETIQSNAKIDVKINDIISVDIGKRYKDDYELGQDNPYIIDENEEFISEETNTYTVVGIIKRPSGTIEPYSAPGYTLITSLKENDKQKSDVYISFNQSGLKNSYKTIANIVNIDPKLYEEYKTTTTQLAKEELDKIINEFEKAKYEFITNDYLIKLETNPLSISTNRSLGVIVTIVAIIIVFTSIFCIKNSFDISITEKIKQYGMLKSVGATKKQIKNSVLFEAVLLGIIGVPLGIFCGLIAAYILVNISNILLSSSLADNLRIYFSIKMEYLEIAIILGSITIYFSAIKSAKKAAKISSIELIKNSGNIKIESKKIKIPKIVSKIFGIGGVLSFKNLKRNKRKYKTTIISLTISIATFISLFYFTSNIYRSLEKEFLRVEYTYSYTVKDYDDYKDKIEESVKLEGIENYSIIRNQYINIKQPKINKDYIKEDIYQDSIEIDLLSLGTKEYQNFIDKLGLNINDANNKVILIDAFDSSNNHLFDYQDGDEIELIIKDKAIKFEIIKVTNKTAFSLASDNITALIVSDEMFEKFNQDHNYANVYIYTKDVDTVDKQIKDIFKDYSINAVNVLENKQQIENLLLLVNIFLYGFIGVITLIGITNVYNTITTNIELRKQEFAMLKSIGMTKKEFNRMINLESALIGSKSLIYGCIIGSIIAYLIYKVNIEAIPDFKYPFDAVMICMVVVLILINSLMKYSVNKINKQNIIETIRNENI